MCIHVHTCVYIYTCIDSHMYTYIYMYIYAHTFTYVVLQHATSHTWTGHVIRMDTPCETCEYVMLHIWMSHVTHMKNPCRTSKWIMFHIMYIAYEYKTSRMRIRHVTHMNEPCHTYEESMSHTQMNHVTHYIYCQCIYSNMHVGAYIRAESCSWVMPHVSKSTTAHM